MSAALDAAEQFLAGHGRVLERRRFARLFRDGDAAPVRDAVAAYRNPDGGFGHGIEPDGRGPESQPVGVLTALSVLDEADAWDRELVRGALDFLHATAPADGGTPFVLPGVERWPHAPWWAAEDGLPPSLTSTGQLVAPLLRRGEEHPWLDCAIDWLWGRAAAPGELGEQPSLGYELRGLVAFLDHVPDASRAEAALDALAGVIRGGVAERPGMPGEQHSPLDLSPHPGARSRRVFDPASIDAHLDALASAQEDDGGWTFSWPQWSPVAAADWRGVVTADALAVLRANGRL